MKIQIKNIFGSILIDGDFVSLADALFKSRADLYGVIVKLLISANAKRSHAFGRKCRASEARVLEVIGAMEGVSSHDKSVVYRKGKIVKCKYPFCEDYREECASGIHFFITRLEAENYVV